MIESMDQGLSLLENLVQRLTISINRKASYEEDTCCPRLLRTDCAAGFL
jgi:hypothetical protein